MNALPEPPARAPAVLILVENLSVPFDRRVWQESLALTAAGYEVTVICPRGADRDLESFELRSGVRIHRFDVGHATAGIPGYAREYTRAAWEIRRLVRRLERTTTFDVVHACNPPDFLLPLAWRLGRKGAALVFDHHDLVPELYLSRFGRGEDVIYRATLALERVTFKLADVVLSTNESYRRIAITRGGKEPEDVFVVRNAPDLSRFSPVEPDLSRKRGKTYLLVYLGTMGPQDGVDHAVRALAALARKRHDWHAVFMGGGDVLIQMTDLAERLGVGEMIDFLGPVYDDEVLLRVLSTADVCLAPDPLNPLNDVSTMIKIVEYMAMARPIVSYDLRESRVSAGLAAAYAEPNDIESFASTIDRLLDDPDLRTQMGTIGRDRVVSDLSWESSKSALRSAYEHALMQRGTRRDGDLVTRLDGPVTREQSR